MKHNKLARYQGYEYLMVVQLSSLIEEAHKFRFKDPKVEAAYHAERIGVDSSRVRRVLAVLIVLLVFIGGVLNLIARVRGGEPPITWIVLRFGVLAPALIISWALVGTEWGRKHLQAIQCVGVGIAVGAFSAEWVSQWTVDMPIRGVWVVPVLTFWGATMALPVSARTVVAMTALVYALTAASVAILLPELGVPATVAALLVFSASGFGINLFARWREAEAREAFVHRLQTKVLAEELRERNETLLRINKLRDQFVEGVLHDIRSPLTAIFMSSSLMQDEPDISSDERKNLAAGILKSGEHIDRFVNRFLEQRSLDRAEPQLSAAPMSLDSAIANVVTRARMTADLKRQKLIVESLLTEVTVTADELLLDRSLANLVDNAIKYSPIKARITVRVQSDPYLPDRVRVSITDQGPGISEKERAQLFQPYSRLEKTPTGGEHSVGLGLSLVKKWMEAMGGSVGCESELGSGATFWISLPRQ